MQKQFRFSGMSGTRPSHLSGNIIHTDTDPRDPSLLRTLAAMARCCSQMDGRSCAYVTRQGEWLASSEGAEALLGKRSSGIFVDLGRLCATPERQAELDRLLEVEEGVESCIVPNGDRSSHIVLRAARLCPTIVCILANEACDKDEPNFTCFCTAFSLTAAEDRVLHSVLAGHAPKEVAAMLDISINTVRVHLRHCYEKLGVSSREELWRKVYPYRLG